MINLLHESVISVADHRPESLAFSCGDQQLKYAQLAQDSRRLSNFLIQEGVQKGDRIGVFMPRCVETIIAVYGILEAGCVFVPIDPNLSAGGVATLLKDAGIRLLLSHPKKSRILRKLVLLDTSLECVIGVNEELDGDDSTRVFPWEIFKDEAESRRREIPIRSSDAAYIMYSSGSTGRPKGITHTHFSGLSYARLSVATYGVTSNDVIANHSPISFDMSTFGYFASCLAGAKTVLIPEAHTKFPASLAKLMEQEQITIWYSVPLALIQLLLRTSLDAYDLSSIRWVKFGGEPFPPKHLRALMKAWPEATFSNVYGPAEVNQCTYYHVPPGYANDDSNLPIPIGKIWNESFGLVVDQVGQVIDDGSVGELFVNSPTMMQGYWDRPDRSKDSFWHHRDEDGNERVYYKTGDLVKKRPDGNLMFLGRKDRQIKVRGYRIEMDEVENAINAFDEIEEAGVFCVQTGEEKEIHAVAIPKSGFQIDPEQLKSRLGESLSPYAIPSTVQFVESLPRTNSGKIDRNRLAQDAQGVAQS